MTQSTTGVPKDVMGQLTPELVRMIVNIIHNVKDLARLCEVNKGWNAIFQPEVYIFDMKNDRMALRFASIKGDISRLKTLVELDSQFAERNNEAALKEAIAGGHVEYTEALLQLCPDGVTDSILWLLECGFRSMPSTNRSHVLHRAMPETFGLAKHFDSVYRNINGYSQATKAGSNSSVNYLAHDLRYKWTTDRDKAENTAASPNSLHQHLEWWSLNHIEVHPSSSGWGVRRCQTPGGNVRPGCQWPWKVVSSHHLHYRLLELFGESMIVDLDPGKQIWGFKVFRNHEVRFGVPPSELLFENFKSSWIVQYEGTAESSPLAMDLLGHLLRDWVPESEPKPLVQFDTAEGPEKLLHVLENFDQIESYCGEDYALRRQFVRQLQSFFNTMPHADRRVALELHKADYTLGHVGLTRLRLRPSANGDHFCILFGMARTLFLNAMT